MCRSLLHRLHALTLFTTLFTFGVRSASGFDLPVYTATSHVAGVDGFSQLSVGNLTVGTANIAYYVTLSVGTPPVDIHSLLDSGSSDLLFETSVQDDTCRIPGCPLTGTLYSPSNSSTSQSSDTKLDLVFGEGKSSGNVVTDMVTLGDYGARQAFLAASMNSHFTSVGAVTGLLGLGLRNRAFTNSVPFVEQMYKSGHLDAPEFGLGFLSGQANVGGQTFKQGGVLTLGGTNSSFYSGDLTWIDVRDKESGYWSLPVAGLSVNGVDLSFSTDGAVINSGTNLINLPSALVKAIYSALGGTYSDALQRFTYDCRKTTLSFKIGENMYNIGPENFQAEKQNDGSYCLGAVVSLSDDSKPWTIGTPFFESYYTAFRFDPLQIGLAPAAVPAQKSKPSTTSTSDPSVTSNDSKASPTHASGTPGRESGGLRGRPSVVLGGLALGFAMFRAVL